jgi:hypothetical protein
MAELRVQVVDDEIIVTLPGSHYSVTYYKPAKSPQLLAKHFSDRDDPRVAMRLSEFLALAWRLANDKARELGVGRVSRWLRAAPQKQSNSQHLYEPERGCIHGVDSFQA